LSGRQQAENVEDVQNNDHQQKYDVDSGDATDDQYVPNESSQESESDADAYFQSKNMRKKGKKNSTKKNMSSMKLTKAPPKKAAISRDGAVVRKESSIDVDTLIHLFTKSKQYYTSILGYRVNFCVIAQ